MKKKVRTLPKDARYDYTDIYGEKIYHTERKRYTVSKKMEYGKSVTKIYSEPLTD